MPAALCTCRRLGRASALPNGEWGDHVTLQAAANSVELYKLASADALGPSMSSVEQHQNESILAQDWHGPSGRHSNSEFQSNKEESSKRESSLPDIEELSHGSEYQMCSHR